MIEYYPHIKSAHMLIAALVGLVFIARVLAMQFEALRTIRTLLRYLSWTVDVMLLTAAMMLLTMLPMALYANGWLTAKLFLLVLFVLCRHFALASSPWGIPRWLWTLLALGMFAQAFHVARTHQPMWLP